MSEATKARWDEIYAARFGKRLTDREFHVWEDELEREVRNLKEDEIIEAIRALGERKRKGELKHAPQVEEIKSAVIKARWEERQAALPPAEECSCSSGWVLVAEEGRGAFNVPCGCSKGVERLRTNYPDISSRQEARFKSLRDSWRWEVLRDEKVRRLFRSPPDVDAWIESGPILKSWWAAKFPEHCEAKGFKLSEADKKLTGVFQDRIKAIADEQAMEINRALDEKDNPAFP